MARNKDTTKTDEKLKKEKIKTVKIKLSFPERSYFYGGKVLTGKKTFEIPINSPMYLEMRHRIGRKGEFDFYKVEEK